VWGTYGGWQIIVLDLVIVGAVVSGEESFRRWRYRLEFVRREFAEPQPIHQQAEPAPRTEARQETPPNEPGVVTSMRQAYEILGLPPGRITLDAVRTVYRTRMMEYHPDRVTHLGPELRKLAERKAKQFNLAMEFIEREAK
jgi:DnaJ like chaperone protein